MKKLKIILEMIKFKHTIFALPFAFLGAVLGSLLMTGGWPSIAEWIWITLAMVGARSAAMSLNRLIDANIDKDNPRTASRAIPAGLISRVETVGFIIFSFALLFFSAYQLNMLAVYLLPLTVFFLVFYSYTKRFTWACHIFLGITIGLAPLGGWVGATGSLTTWVPYVLFIAVALWTAGFDVIYATQDTKYDKKVKLHSIPSRFGIGKALLLAKVFHIVSFIAMVVLFFITPLGWIYLIGVLIAGGLMAYEHSLVSPQDLSKVNVAFFTMNGIISLVMLAFTIGDLLLWTT
ncbi:UbiA-like polyprenyltransferase [Evansella cellulosilytica]|uniref:4-hydroxybenzoate polyprenyltransferase n=1 Tax=Evansella cellulosilytica (strain ATCC 21833 / DSM 2522 / FERM P-1141 / JCM 9156 / N-4) TaxID=649639 RepID=E6TZF5_EVAC2|nr:UbiA-like polyprenyltransferase [Evansella cellulosilytica]ADU30129.1 4-hydroxybenzoate polyprenyltransferase [Evansella cellulosilytica DSM 2522]